MRRSLGMTSSHSDSRMVSSILSLVGFESPNFGHAFLDGFEDLDRIDEEKEDSYFGEESQSFRNPRINRIQDSPFGRSGRPRTLSASDGMQMQPRYPPTGLHGLRELSSNGTHTLHTPGGGFTSSTTSTHKDRRQEESPLQHQGIMGMMEPEPSLDDLLYDPLPDWALCCVCHEASLLKKNHLFHLLNRSIHTILYFFIY